MIITLLSATGKLGTEQNFTIIKNLMNIGKQVIKMKKIVSSVLTFTFLLGPCNISTYASTIEPYNFDYTNSNFTITKTDNSTKGIININNCNANKLFNFKFNLNPDETLVTAKELLGEDCDTGEVFVIDAHKKIKQIIKKPWAIDTKGKEIPTYFNVSGNILTQTVNHSCSDSFPITADPNAWQITVCVASIVTALTSIAIPVAKIVKIKKAIKIVGGFSVFAQMCIGLVLGTHSLENIAIAFGPLVVEAFTTILGIDGIIKNCAR